MPNTLVHIALQYPATRALDRRTAAAWILLGTVIPDLPWIMRRVASTVWPNIDPYVLMQYVTVQASLLFCVLLSIAIASLARRQVIVAAILAANCLAHLLLDAVEIKPGNGVHLVAPWSWELLNFGLVWPEHVAITWLSVAGAVIGIHLVFGTSCQPVLASHRRRAGFALGGAALIAYLALPVMLIDGPYAADNHSIKTLKEQGSRAGRRIMLDRQPYFRIEGAHYIVTYGHEKIFLDGQPLPADGRASVEGVFLTVNTVRPDRLHQNQRSFRDYASVAGLLLVSIAWIRTICKGTD